MKRRGHAINITEGWRGTCLNDAGCWNRFAHVIIIDNLFIPLEGKEGNGLG
jgi:hypothetical protein